MGAKFYEELNKEKQLCAHMDISIKEMGSKPVRLSKDIRDRKRLVYRTEYRNSFFSRGRGGGAALIKNFEPSEGANSNWGAYLKLGANSSIYGRFICRRQLASFAFGDHLRLGITGGTLQ